MTATRTAALLLLWSAFGAAHAQVYRCDSGKVYTDKPCSDARAVDLRPNIVDGGTRNVPPGREPVPQAAIILPNIPQTIPQQDSTPSTVWERKDADDGAHNARTGVIRY